MNWNPHAEAHYVSNGFPYSTIGSFMEYFEGFTYDHVNFIFSGASHTQDSSYPYVHMNLYKCGSSEPGNTAYYNGVHSYEVSDHAARAVDNRRPSTIVSNESTEENPISTMWEENPNMASHDHSLECPRTHSSYNHQSTWQNNIDPDRMTYEELLELGEAVGTENRGLSQEHISALPISKYKCGFFSRKRSRKERCVICQMEYRRGDRQITLPCKHVYHTDCGSRWLSINKACPICYTEVFGNKTNTKK